MTEDYQQIVSVVYRTQHLYYVLICPLNMYLWLLLLLVLLLCAYLVVAARTWRARSNYAHLPTYPQLPLAGSAYKIYGDSKKLFLTLDDMTKKAEAANKPFALWVGPIPALVLSDPDDMRTVANAFLEKPYYYNFARVWLGDGLVTAPGWIWKKNIKKIATTFIGPAIDQYQVIFNEQAQKLLQKLRPEVDGDLFYCMPYLSLSSMETICQAGLGMPKSKSLVTEEYYRAFNRTLELLIARGTNIFLHPEWLYRLTPAYKDLLQCVSVLHNVSKTVLNSRKLERTLRNGEINTKDTEKNGSIFKPFLDLFLDLSENDPSLTEEQILAEVATIILAGQETVASALFYTLLVVGSRGDVQEKLYDEIERVVGDRDVMKEDLPQLSYTEAVINESLRLYPPIVGVLRYADHDLKLSSCTITKGTTAVLNIWGAGKSERFWGKDAAEFKPERWLPPNVPCVSAHLPFSTGKRACIGKKYAMAYLKTILVNCVRSYEIISEDSFNRMEFKIDIALRPVNGHLMKLRLRRPTN